MKKKKKKKNFGLLMETDVNEVSVRSSSNPMPTGQRYGGKDLLPISEEHLTHLKDMKWERINCMFED